MSVVFVDIDGVIVLKHLLHPERGPPWKRVRKFSYCAVANLNALAELSGARFVLSSSWRTRGDVRPALVAGGVRVAWHEDWRTDSVGPCRGAEIGRWLAAHDDPPYCVLDDGIVGPGVQVDRLVYIDYRAGLTAEDARRAFALLKPPGAEIGQQLAAEHRCAAGGLIAAARN